VRAALRRGNTGEPEVASFERRATSASISTAAASSRAVRRSG